MHVRLGCDRGAFSRLLSPAFATEQFERHPLRGANFQVIDRLMKSDSTPSPSAQMRKQLLKVNVRLAKDVG